MTAGVVDKGTFIDEPAIDEALRAAATKDAGRVREILAKARELNGLEMDEVAVLSSVSDPELLGELFTTARDVKDAIYGARLVLFAPLYISNLCNNDCLYCAFRVRNKELKRRALTQAEIRHEVEVLVDQGHKRVLLVAGESYPKQGFGYVLDCDRDHLLRETRERRDPPRQRQRGSALRGRLQGPQGQRHRDLSSSSRRPITAAPTPPCTWAARRRTTTGASPGCTAPWRPASTTSASACCSASSTGASRSSPSCSTCASWSAPTGWARTPSACRASSRPSVPTWRSEPPQPVSDVDFRKIVAILRLAVPYTGMIMSTRETANIRRETFALGVSQISAGSRTNPGGYEEDEKFDTAQFQLGDHRSLDEVIRDVAELGYVPSFCTACYRLGRTGMDFMDLAKPGDIKHHCDPNALATFLEYLIDYGSEETRAAGHELIARKVAEMDDVRRAHTQKMLDQVRAGGRDVLC